MYFQPPPFSGWAATGLSFNALLHQLVHGQTRPAHATRLADALPVDPDHVVAHNSTSRRTPPHFGQACRWGVNRLSRHTCQHALQTRLDTRWRGMRSRTFLSVKAPSRACTRRSSASDISCHDPPRPASHVPARGGQPLRAASPYRRGTAGRTDDTTSASAGPSVDAGCTPECARCGRWTVAATAMARRLPAHRVL